MVKKFSDKVKALELGNPPPETAGIFGAEFTSEESELVLISVPFDATASYGTGAEFGPDLILKASHQLDLEDLTFGKSYRKGMFLSAVDDAEIKKLNAKAKNIISELSNDHDAENNLVEERSALTEQVNILGGKVNEVVFCRAKKFLDEKKIVGVIGGDHSAPFGLIKALSERYTDFGILHIDAHFDLRSKYEGFEWSHASIMNNVLEKIPVVSQISHVAIRDFSAEEKQYQINSSNRSKVYYSAHMFERKAAGESFEVIVDELIKGLPNHVYISFDIDGLDPVCCPGTGTPVPGGLQFEEACYLINKLGTSGKSVIGFDLCEVASSNENDWDGNVGARILYKLCGSAINSKFGHEENK